MITQINDLHQKQIQARNCITLLKYYQNTGKKFVLMRYDVFCGFETCGAFFTRQACYHELHLSYTQMREIYSIEDALIECAKDL